MTQHKDRLNGLYRLAALLLSIEATNSVIAVLGIDIEGFMLNVVLPFFEFLVNILGFEYFADASFKDQLISLSSIE